MDCVLLSIISYALLLCSLVLCLGRLGTPQDSGISLETVVKLGPSIPLFGVCMGLQCMGEAYGGEPLAHLSQVDVLFGKLLKDPSFCGH